jgi:carboxylesterase
MSQREVDSSAFDLAPSGGDGRSAALCLHGLTGTPYEVRPVAERLAAQGIRARGPALPGHLTTPADLATKRHPEWVDFARAEVAKLRKEHEHVYCVGVSMGGVVSLALGIEGAIDALAVVGVPLKLRPAALVGLVPIVKHVHRYLPKRQGSDIQDPEARGRHPGYDRMPLHSVHELIKMQRIVGPQLALITAPILVAHGAFDRTASPRDAHRIAGEVSSEERRLLSLPRSGHVVPVDHDGPFLAGAIADFLDGRVGRRPSAAIGRG